MGRVWRTIWHPRRVSRELEAAEAQLCELAEESATHARNAQALRDELQAARDELAAMQTKLAKSESSADAVAEELMTTRQRLSDTEQALRESDRQLKQAAEENRSLAIRLRDQHETDEIAASLERRITQAEQMKSTYTARVKDLKEQLTELQQENARLRAAQSIDTDSDWFSLPPDL